MSKSKTFRFVKWARNYLGNLTKTARKLNKRIDVKISSEKESFGNCKIFFNKIIFFNSLINLSFERLATPAMFCLIDFLTDELWV